MVGRPSSYSDEVAGEICDRIGDGESLRSICNDADMPDQRTVHRWLVNPALDAFRQQYTRARETQADTFVDEVSDIADNSTPDNWTVARLRVQTRQWAAGKLAPKKYGDRLDQYIKQETTLRTVSDKPEDTKEARESWIADHGNVPASTNGKGNGHG